MRLKDINGPLVTIEKWLVTSDEKVKAYYWIVGSDGAGIDGFSKKSQAIDAIERWGMVRINKIVKIRS